MTKETDKLLEVADFLYYIQELEKAEVIYNLVEEKYDDSIKDIIPLKDIEKIYIKKALEIYGDTTEGKKLAAKKLGIGIATLYRKLE